MDRLRLYIDQGTATAGAIVPIGPIMFSFITNDQFVALIVLAAVSAFTPGPNNALVTTSGLNFGFRRTIPHMLGISFGFGGMVFLVALFLGQLFIAFPILHEILRWAGAALLLYVAYQIATSGGLSSRKGEPRPFTLIEAALFQWVNPKGWAMAIAVSAQFVNPNQVFLSCLLLGAVFVFMGFTSSVTWTAIGQGLRRILSSDRSRKVFNISMAILVAGCIVFLFTD